MSTEYRSKIDAWLIAVLALALALAMFGLYETATVDPQQTAWLAALIAVFGVGLPVHLLLTTRYELDARQLEVRSGFFKWIVPLKDVSAITPTRNPLSSPALSLDRLRIDYGGKSIMISPQDKQAFLREFESRRRADKAATSAGP